MSQKDRTIPYFGQHSIIALGSNMALGDVSPIGILGAAIRELGHEGLRLRRLSRFYSTPCFPPGAGPDYVNAAALIAPERDGYTPEEILAALHRIEARFERRRERRWASRTLDLDLIAAGDAVRPDRATWEDWRDLTLGEQQRLAPGELILPHPRLADRAFVLVPLADIAPGWRHPVTDLSVTEMLAALGPGARAEITPF
ncbi:2-amino-4-hydroxy-6-hydroxymethyldihydropteridine diphosphokinase [Litorisediminicola beolgyonensis]|uniref:2-amino-4-hydroxy-6-hydroxymethyldihydropteridine pyrophosphokinase n=1 Tax=Litorisediminicola beolgyonensis TaxID=1173614 RepID=A0ABW3ZI85_9RHOB